VEEHRNYALAYFSNLNSTSTSTAPALVSGTPVDGHQLTPAMRMAAWKEKAGKALKGAESLLDGLKAFEHHMPNPAKR